MVKLSVVSLHGKYFLKLLYKKTVVEALVHFTTEMDITIVSNTNLLVHRHLFTRVTDSVICDLPVV